MRHGEQLFSTDRNQRKTNILRYTIDIWEFIETRAVYEADVVSPSRWEYLLDWLNWSFVLAYKLVLPR